MAQSSMMPGPDGVQVKCFRRSARQVRAGDWLPEYGARAVTDAVTDVDSGRHYVELDSDDLVELTSRGKVWIHRAYVAPEWMVDAVDAYRSARDAREALRESGAAVPTSVPGAAGSAVAFCQLEPEDFAAAVPAPRLADFVRDAAAARRESVAA